MQATDFHSKSVEIQRMYGNLTAERPLWYDAARIQWTFLQQSSAKRENSKAVTQATAPINGIRAQRKLWRFDQPGAKDLKKRVMSAAAESEDSKATKERWAKLEQSEAKGKPLGLLLTPASVLSHSIPRILMSE